MDLFFTHYRLDNQRAVHRASMLEWCFQRAQHPRVNTVGSDYHRDVHVSTVFTGQPAVGSTEDCVLVFETRVFGGKLDGETDRYASWDEAASGHAAILARVVGVEKTS